LQFFEIYFVAEVCGTAMRQVSYRLAGGYPMNPTSRLALFTVALFVLVAVGSQPRRAGASQSSLASLCVCVPARAGLIVKSAIAKTQAQIRSAEVSALRTTAVQ
jgi:hypothetical protein